MFDKYNTKEKIRNQHRYIETMYPLIMVLIKLTPIQKKKNKVIHRLRT